MSFSGSHFEKIPTTLEFIPLWFSSGNFHTVFLLANDVPNSLCCRHKTVSDLAFSFLPILCTSCKTLVTNILISLFRIARGLGSVVFFLRLLLLFSCSRLTASAGTSSSIFNPGISVLPFFLLSQRPYPRSLHLIYIPPARHVEKAISISLEILWHIDGRSKAPNQTAGTARADGDVQYIPWYGSPRLGKRSV